MFRLLGVQYKEDVGTLNPKPLNRVGLGRCWDPLPGILLFRVSGCRGPLKGSYRDYREIYRYLEKFMGRSFGI